MSLKTLVSLITFGNLQTLLSERFKSMTQIATDFGHSKHRFGDNSASLQVVIIAGNLVNPLQLTPH